MLKDKLDLKVENLKSGANLPVVYKHFTCLALNNKSSDIFVNSSVAFCNQFRVEFTRSKNNVGTTLNNIS